MKMKALYYPNHDELLLTELPIPECKATEVLVKVKACGICGSEIETFKNRSPRRLPPLIMGHEFSGVIDAVGADVKGWKNGDAVVSNSVVFCGECDSCKEGKTNLCIRRQVFGMHRNGAFGAYVNVPAASLIAMPPGVDFKEACLTEPLANGVHLVKLTQHLPAKNILVIGAGPIGLAAQQAFAAMRRVTTIVSDIRSERLEIAKQIGADGTINPLTEDVFNRVKSITRNAPLDLVIDAVGSAETNTLALEIVKPGGTVLMIGLYDNSKSLLSYDIVLSEKAVMGSYAATQQDMRDALMLISQKKADVSSWIHYYPLDNGRQAFFDMMEAKGNHIKSVIVFE
ncbi:MAG: alcohol dehydrogenase catalytic domain-containing protein [Chitinophagaceae bacterium]|nr:alcohol dehydrogenase catalytic domain-containing protein [Chitinophagaceae bacterium]